MIRKKKKEGIIMKKQFAFLRRFTALMLALCMLTALTAEIFAADIVASGYCGGEDDGTNLSWTLDSKGTLIIRGTGRMEDYGSDQYGPWPRDKVKNVTIESGVTSIGAYAFKMCIRDSRFLDGFMPLCRTGAYITVSDMQRNVQFGTERADKRFVAV